MDTNELTADAQPKVNRSRVVLICGELGAGKTTVGRGMSDILSAEGIRHGVVDLDALCQLHPSDSDYRDNYDLKWENLAAIWPHFVFHGARYGIVSGSLHSQSDRRVLADMLGDSVSLSVVRLTVSAHVRTARLTAREPDPEVRAWHIERSATATTEGLQSEDFVVANEGRTAAATAQEILDRLGWVTSPGE